MSSSCRNSREIASPSLSLSLSLSMDAGYTGEGKGADWVEKTLGWTAQIPDEVMRVWVREWAKEGVAIEWKKLLSPKGSRSFLPRRWVVERTFSWLSQNRRMSKDHERLATTSEAFI